MVNLKPDIAIYEQLSQYQQTKSRRKQYRSANLVLAKTTLISNLKMEETMEEEETFTFRDTKPVPDVTHSYTNSLRDEKVPIVIDHGSILFMSPGIFL